MEYESKISISRPEYKRKIPNRKLIALVPLVLASLSCIISGGGTPTPTSTPDLEDMGRTQVQELFGTMMKIQTDFVQTPTNTPKPPGAPTELIGAIIFDIKTPMPPLNSH